jgi:hypothetical protein
MAWTELDSGVADNVTVPSLSVLDSTFSVKDQSDVTKVLQFQCSGITTATTRTLTVPDASGTMTVNDATQTLTNKTLTTPAITTPAITGDVTVTSGKAKIAGTTAGGLAVGGNYYDHVLVAVGYQGNPLTNEHQVGVYSALSGNSNVGSPADGFVCGFETALKTDAGSFTLPLLNHYAIGSVTKGAGTTITRTVGVKSLDETAGTNNAFIAPDGSTFTGDWFIYYDGTRATKLGGALQVGGDVTFSGATEIQNDSTTDFIRIKGGTSGAPGANIIVFSGSHASAANTVQINGSAGVSVSGPLTIQTGAKIRSGTGTPESAVTGSVGDLFLRTDGGANTTLYVKESGSATNTGWVAK